MLGNPFLRLKLPMPSAIKGSCNDAPPSGVTLSSTSLQMDGDWIRQTARMIVSSTDANAPAAPLER